MSCNLTKWPNSNDRQFLIKWTLQQLLNDIHFIRLTLYDLHMIFFVFFIKIRN